MISPESNAVTCTPANVSPVVSCDTLSITGNNLTINVGPGITLGGAAGIAVDASSTGLDLTIASGAYTITYFAGLNNNGTINTLTNNGTMSGNVRGSYNTGTINTLINNGTISGNAQGIENTGTITTLTNTGTISGGASIRTDAGSGTLGTLNNLQGSSGALIYWNKLPNNYNIIVNSTLLYGKLAVTSPTSSMVFGIYSGGVAGVAASTLTARTYPSVLTGITSGNLSGSTSGTYGAYNWVLNNVNDTNWDLIVSLTPVVTPVVTPEVTPGVVPVTTPLVVPVITNITSGTSFTLSSIGVTANPVLAGGTLVLTQGQRSTQALSILGSGSTITASSTGAAQLSGVLSGSGSLTFNGGGTIVLSGANTYSGGTTIASGIVSLLGGSLGAGDVYVAQGAQLGGTGTIASAVTVAGILKPGNSPGYLATSANVTMTSGSVYQQDIAGTMQASAASPVGATGYYSYLNIAGSQFVINTGSTLTPALSNLFNVLEPGYGSTPYTPVLGDRFRILSADGGIVGKFSSVTQPAELTMGTQFLPFYNMAGGNSIDLAVIPTSYKNTIAMASGNKNAQSVGAALDKMVVRSQAGVSNAAQDQLLYAGSANNASSLSGYAQGLAGEVYSAAVAVIAQTTQRVQQAVLSRLGDTMGLGLSSAMTSPAGNTALMAASNTALSGGVASSAVSTNPGVNPNADAQAFSNGNVWGDLAYQKGNRSSDSNSGGWNSNLYQLVFGSDFYVSEGMRAGGGIALSSTTLNPTYGSGTIQQGSVFAYGKMPIEAFVLNSMASFGLNSSDLSRGDGTGLSNGFRSKTISGNDAMVSLGISRPIDVESVRITPYARVTWQMVTQSSVNEGNAASALSVNSFTGNGVRGVLGVAVGSKANDPMTEPYTYRAYVGVGADSSGLLNPTLNASIAGIGTNITTPNAGTSFVQAGLYGTARVSDNAYAFAGLSGEARSGQTLGVVNVGLRIQF